jgi:hypothetical protein
VDSLQIRPSDDASQSSHVVRNETTLQDMRERCLSCILGTGGELCGTATSHQTDEPSRELACLLSSPLCSPPPAHDEERGRFEVFEPPASVGLMHVTVAPETEGPQVIIGLTSQSFVGGMVQVDALIRSACRAPSRQAGEVLALSLLPLRRLEVSAVLGTVPGHGPRSCRSPHPVLRTSTNDANQRRLTTNRKP